MKLRFTHSCFAVYFVLVFGCSADLQAPSPTQGARSLNFGAERRLGNGEKNPSTPFLRYSPDGRLFAVWTEAHDTPWPQGSHTGHQRMIGDRAPSPMRNALIAWSKDGGESWSAPKRLNHTVEAVQGEENGPKVAFTLNSKVFVVWSIPGVKGDKTRANIRLPWKTAKAALQRRAR